MNLGATSFDDIYAVLDDARAQVRVGQYVITEALTSGRMQQKDETEQGMTTRSEMNIRVKESAEDSRYPLTIGKVIEVDHDGRGWERVRIAGRKNIAGIIMLDVETVYE
jgi:hypothetical protein